jgi:hypothetical protein
MFLGLGKTIVQQHFDIPANQQTMEARRADEPKLAN